MDPISLILSFIFGTLIGSFLNVVALRYNTGMTLQGRSKCFSCEKKLAWYELIPIFSYALQRGKCRGCRSRISAQYILVELATGILFAFIFYFFPPFNLAMSITTLFYVVTACILMLITIYDIRHQIIPNALVYTFIALSFIKIFFVFGLYFEIPSVWNLFAGPLLAIPFALIWLISKGKWMGFGDIKLIIGIGWFLGLQDGVSAIILACWIGSIIGIIIMYATFRKFKARYEMPFGPYLILGVYIVLLTGLRVI